MKAFLVILGLTVVAAVATASPVEDKGIIGDALALKKCLEDTIHDLEHDVDVILHSINSIAGVISTAIAQVKVCEAIGGDNPSIIDQIAQANCFIATANKFRQDMVNTLNEIGLAFDDLVHAFNKIDACFNPAPAPIRV